MRNGKPALLSYIQGGDRANGGIRGAWIEGGLLWVERLGSRLSQAIGAEFIDTTTYRLSGSKLLGVGKPVRRENSAVLPGVTSGTDFYVLGARENQTLTVRISSLPNNARFEIIISDYTMAYRVSEWSGKLEMLGDFHLIVLSNKGSADYKLEVSVR